MFSSIKSHYQSSSRQLFESPEGSLYQSFNNSFDGEAAEAALPTPVPYISTTAQLQSYDSTQIGCTTTTSVPPLHHNYIGAPKYVSVTPAPSSRGHYSNKGQSLSSNVYDVSGRAVSLQGGHLESSTAPNTAAVKEPCYSAHFPFSIERSDKSVSVRSVSSPRLSNKIEDSTDEGAKVTCIEQVQQESDVSVSLQLKRDAGIKFAMSALSQRGYGLFNNSSFGDDQEQNKLIDSSHMCDNLTNMNFFSPHHDPFVGRSDVHCSEVSDYLPHVRKKHRVCNIWTKGSSTSVSDPIFNIKGHFDSFNMSSKGRPDPDHFRESKRYNSLADIAAASRCPMVDHSKRKTAPYSNTSRKKSDAAYPEKGAAYPSDCPPESNSTIETDKRISLLFEKACAHLQSEGLPFSSTVGETAVVCRSPTSLDTSIQSPTISIKEEMHSVLYYMVHRFVSPIVREEIGTTWAIFDHMVRLFVSANTVPLCPRIRGIIKRIDSGKPAPVPIDLLPEDDALINSICTKYRSNDYLIDDKDLGYQIRRYQLESCFGREKLNDQVINYYLELVAHKISGVTVLLSSLFSKLTSGRDREGAFRWVRRRNIFDVRVVLVSINRNDHWTMCVVNNEEKFIAYYDSCGGDGSDVILEVAKFFDECYVRKYPDVKGGGHQYTTAFEHRSPGEGVPQQKNNVDCGVFTMQFGLYAAQGQPFNFTQEDIPFLRKLIAIELMKKQLMRRL